MGEYVLALQGRERIHVGARDAFIQHVGRGADGASFEAARLETLADSFELYDEDGFPLDVELNGAGGAELVIRPNTEPVDGPTLVARVNAILTKAQAELERDRSAAIDALDTRVEQANVLAQDALVSRDLSIESTAAATQATADAFELAKDLLDVGDFPIIEADLAVVLAGLSEDFGSAIHGGPPHRAGRRHNRLHDKGMTHP